jgi:photosystem II stability/assembly factor-like uncharacterized protein
MSLIARAVCTAAAIGMTCAAVLPGTAALAAPGAGLGAAASTHPTAPVPSGFKANSVTWASARQGWVLGAAPCGTKTCSDVIGTSNGARTWHLTGVVSAPIANIGKGTHGITEVRFGTPRAGWIFGIGQDLFRTTDGGATWARVPVPGGAKQILDMAAGASQTYAITSDCTLGKALCPKPLGFWRIATGSGSTWTRIPLNLPKNDAADVAVLGKTVYVVDSQLEFGRPDKLYASTDGVHFAARPAPCDHADDIALVQAVPMPAGHVALLCDGNPGFSKAVKTVYVSANTGKTDTFAGQLGLFGIQAQLAASPSGNLAVASSSDGSFIYVNDTHKTTWTMTEGLGDGGVGWNDISYVSDTRAWVVYGPADFTDVGQLWVTRDGGHRWSAVKL